jgi:hypothetical protein
MLNLAVFFIATASAAVGGVSWLLTFTPWTQFMSSSYFVPFFYLAFPLFGWSMFVLTFVRRPERDRRQQIDLLKEVRRGWRVPLAVLFVAVWAHRWPGCLCYLASPSTSRDCGATPTTSTAQARPEAS